ncbi:MAG: putative lipid II flippase FtsW [Christensenella sp.]|uniref:putative lipid II flippase FtsW n=1 Tax=Christensenella sp. TaxID=1935934 RepID=UPI002B1F6FAA|nr:putative lipid II flippase FtsW [Christensenella sp.]MEA5002965.1 putative lipid II flippase FtsW [Christensenella sp.]
MRKTNLLQKGSIDYSLLIVTLILIAYGLLMVFSASYYMAQSSKLYDYDGLALFKKQLVGAAIGLVFMIFFMFFDYKKLIKLKYVLLVLAGICLVAVFIPEIGVNVNGSSRWIQLGPLPQLQPAEIAKVALIVFIASVIYVNRNRMNTFRYGVIPSLLALIPVCILLYFQPNFSAIIVLCALTFIMIFVGGAKAWHLLALGGAGVVGGFVLMTTGERAGYRVDRLLSFTEPWQNASGGGYQVLQSLYGIGSGGLFGQGIGNGTQKLSWLPYGESDFIFAIIGEELGLIGAIVLLALFIFLIYRGIKTAAQSPDLFGTMLATGVTTVIALQVIINVGVVTASLPPTGVSLPFISYGSSSLVIFMSMIGIMLNISKQSRRIMMAKRTEEE